MTVIQLRPKTVQSKRGIVQIICRNIPDGRTDGWCCDTESIPVQCSTVCGVAPSVHFGKQITSVSEKLHRQLMYTIQKDTRD